MRVEVLERSAAALTVEEAKRHLRITSSSEDGDIEALVAVAQDHIERTSGRAFLTAKYRLTVESFPSCGELRLPRVPVQTIDSVTYLDADGAEQTLSDSLYRLSRAAFSSSSQAVALVTDAPFPVTDWTGDAVSVSFTAGETDAANLPRELVHLTKLVVGTLYRERASFDEGRLFANPTYEHLMQAIRVLEY